MIRIKGDTGNYIKGNKSREKPFKRWSFVHAENIEQSGPYNQHMNEEKLIVAKMGITKKQFRGNNRHERPSNANIVGQLE